MSPTLVSGIGWRFGIGVGHRKLRMESGVHREIAAGPATSHMRSRRNACSETLPRHSRDGLSRIAVMVSDLVTTDSTFKTRKDAPSELQPQTLAVTSWPLASWHRRCRSSVVRLIMALAPRSRPQRRNSCQPRSRETGNNTSASGVMDRLIASSTADSASQGRLAQIPAALEGDRFSSIGLDTVQDHVNDVTKIRVLRLAALHEPLEHVRILAT